MASNNNDNDANAIISDIYRMVMEGLEAANVACLSVECIEYFNHLLHQEIPNETNSRDKL
jgi:hypothetical protein